MSVCDNHGAGNFGKTHSLYVTIIRDGIRFNRRMRVCQTCVADLSSFYSDQWSDGFVLTKFHQEQACNGCGQLRGPTGTLYALYATGYGRADQRYDYHAAYCSACAQSLISSLRLVEQNGHA